MTNAELARCIARLESSMTGAVSRLEDKLDRVTDDHEQRIRRVERWMWTCLGLSAAGAGAGLSAWFGG